MSGSRVRTSATFVNVTGGAADPTTVTLKYKTGAGTVTTVIYPAAPIMKDSTGVYHADFDTTGWSGPDALLYATEWTGTGDVQAIGSDYFQVTPAAL